MREQRFLCLAVTTCNVYGRCNWPMLKTLFPSLDMFNSRLGRVFYTVCTLMQRSCTVVLASLPGWVIVHYLCRRRGGWACVMAWAYDTYSTVFWQCYNPICISDNVLRVCFPLAIRSLKKLAVPIEGTWCPSPILPPCHIHHNIISFCVFLQQKTPCSPRV